MPSVSAAAAATLAVAPAPPPPPLQPAHSSYSHPFQQSAAQPTATINRPEEHQRNGNSNPANSNNNSNSCETVAPPEVKPPFALPLAPASAATPAAVMSATTAPAPATAAAPPPPPSLPAPAAVGSSSSASSPASSSASLHLQHLHLLLEIKSIREDMRTQPQQEQIEHLRAMLEQHHGEMRCLREDMWRQQERSDDQIQHYQHEFLRLLWQLGAQQQSGENTNKTNAIANGGDDSNSSGNPQQHVIVSHSSVSALTNAIVGIDLKRRAPMTITTPCPPAIYTISYPDGGNVAAIQQHEQFTKMSSGGKARPFHFPNARVAKGKRCLVEFSIPNSSSSLPAGPKHSNGGGGNKKKGGGGGGGSAYFDPAFADICFALNGSIGFTSKAFSCAKDTQTVSFSTATQTFQCGALQLRDLSAFGSSNIGGGDNEEDEDDDDTFIIHPSRNQKGIIKNATAASLAQQSQAVAAPSVQPQPQTAPKKFNVTHRMALLLDYSGEVSASSNASGVLGFNKNGKRASFGSSGGGSACVVGDTVFTSVHERRCAEEEYDAVSL